MPTATLSLPKTETLVSDVPKPLIVVDLDNTLVDMFQAFLTFIYERHPYLGHKTHQEQRHYDFRDTFPDAKLDLIYKEYNTFVVKHSFHFQPLPGAYEALRELEETYALRILTARNPIAYDMPALRQVTLDWVAEHFPGIFSQVSFCCDFGDLEKSTIIKDWGAVMLMDDAASHAAHTSLSIPVLMHEEPWTQEIHELKNVNMNNIHIFDSWHGVPELVYDLLEGE